MDKVGAIRALCKRCIDELEADDGTVWFAEDLADQILAIIDGGN